MILYEIQINLKETEEHDIQQDILQKHKYKNSKLKNGIGNWRREYWTEEEIQYRYVTRLAPFSYLHMVTLRNITKSPKD